MKYTISIELDGYEDRSELKNIAHMKDIVMANWEARDLIRSRLKYEIEDRSTEAVFLEKLREALYVPGIDD
jgi:hypothetical protein